MSRRICFALDLIDDQDLIDEYCRMHSPGNVWPEVIDHLRARGMSAMEIWQRRDRLVMIVEVTPDFPRPEGSRSGAEWSERWEALMDRYQKPLHQVVQGQKWAPLQRIFCLADHSGTRNR